MQSVTVTHILQAKRRLLNVAWITPCVRSLWLSRIVGGDVYLKLENCQLTGSFKVRGALNKLDILSRSAGRRREVLTVSAGNHGLAVAYGASILGLDATVVVPGSAPQVKTQAIKEMGATLEIVGDSYDEAEREALRIAANRDIPFISPYNDVDVIAGQGTIAAEVFEQVPDVQVIVAPVGGGGLLAGLAVMAKALNPRVRVIGVQPKNSPAMYESVRAGRVVMVAETPTLADGLAGNLQEPSVTFPLIQRYVDQIMLVSEENLRQAVTEVLAHERLIVEGAAAVPVAMLLWDSNGLGCKKIVTVLTGRNIDFPVLQDLIGLRRR